MFFQFQNNNKLQALSKKGPRGIMDNLNKPFTYHGTIDSYYPIFLKNLLFNILTLFIYSSWATTNNRKYFVGNTEFAGKKYTYHGSGAELFIGRLKALGLIISISVIYVISVAVLENISNLLVGLSVFAFVFIIFSFMPIAIVGALKYRLSRTSWNEIRHTFSEDYRVFIPVFLKGLLLTIITLGIYGPFFIVTIWRFAISNSKMGDKEFFFSGSGVQYFIIALKGIFLIPLTFGIYSFWYLANVWNYVINNVSLDKTSYKSNISGVDVFSLVFPNILILIVTIGLGWPIVITRILTFYANRIYMEDGFDPASVHHAPVDMETATGEGLGVLLDLDL